MGSFSHPSTPRSGMPFPDGWATCALWRIAGVLCGEMMPVKVQRPVEPPAPGPRVSPHGETDSPSDGDSEVVQRG